MPKEANTTPSSVSALRNPDAEIYALSLLVWQDPLIYDKTWMIRSLEVRDFACVERAKIFKVVEDLHERGAVIDPTTVTAELQKTVGSSPNQYVFDWIGDDRLATTGQAKFYVERILDASRRRQLMNELVIIASKLKQRSEGLLDIVGQLREVLLDVSIPVNIDYEKQLREVIMSICNDYGTEEGLGFETGFPKIDRLLGGFRQGEMVMVTGRPKTGKTWLMLNLLARMVMDGRRILATSGEIQPKEVVTKLLCRLAKVNYQRYRMQKLDDSELKRFMAASSKLARQGDFVVLPKSEAPSISMITAKALEFKPEIVAIDAVYLYSPRNVSEGWEYYVAVSRELKNMSTETNSLVLATHQKNKAGNMAYTDAFWQDANFVMEFGSSDSLGPKSKINVKGREGEPFSFNLHVDFSRSLIGEAAPKGDSDFEYGKNIAPAN